MGDYILKRLATSLLVLFALATASFFIIHFVPGDPVRQMLGSSANPEMIEKTRHVLGLDQALPQQFAHFLFKTFTGDFGDSLSLGAPISSLIGNRVMPSVILIIYGVLIALVIGIPLAILSALRPQSVIDNAVLVMTTFTFAMPQFWLGLVLALVFGLFLNMFPVSGYEGGIGGILQTLTLPAFTLGLSLVAMVVRTLRARLLDVLGSEYIEAARARGLSEMRVVGKHAMRNAFMTTLTLLSVQIGFLIGGTVVIEHVFQIPGIGSLLLESILRRDYPLVEIIAVLSGAAVVLVGLLADLLLFILDPRVRMA
ncbi:peptide/nickel transport system permease protein [Pararhizobium capsulatum DSM 1112]|uniref:Peptide/nickel transport system permease protein n=1 Tax=Pararhizobium capsulatum DSM 1112 TaxID=1121113 RepID=A0ABU0BYT7_9HYPH|nr:ABC transporter permease [Pararhizobium capsulatum]MDQ0323430.1 peptide/nickel transport system permease protein [Pararhizobium capsulatum DSM 1112]